MQWNLSRFFFQQSIKIFRFMWQSVCLNLSIAYCIFNGSKHFPIHGCWDQGGGGKHSPSPPHFIQVYPLAHCFCPNKRKIFNAQTSNNIRFLWSNVFLTKHFAIFQNKLSRTAWRHKDSPLCQNRNLNVMTSQPKNSNFAYENSSSFQWKGA